MDTLLNVRDKNLKRKNYLEWEEYFMATAFLAAKRSKDPCSQVGACIVNEDKIIVGIGYNGMPKGCNDNQFPWGKNSENDLCNKYMYVSHAELNAVLNKNSADVKNCIIYVGLFPCNECAKVIIQSGIKEVVYLSDKHCLKATTMASKIMFDAAGVKYRQFIPKHSKIMIDFDEINWSTQNQLPETPEKKDIKSTLNEDDDKVCRKLQEYCLNCLNGCAVKKKLLQYLITSDEAVKFMAKY